MGEFDTSKKYQEQEETFVSLQLEFLARWNH
jgi:hypothetical protein